MEHKGIDYESDSTGLGPNPAAGSKFVFNTWREVP
jgi:hypothetical protein